MPSLKIAKILLCSPIIFTVSGIGIGQANEHFRPTYHTQLSKRGLVGAPIKGEENYEDAFHINVHIPETFTGLSKKLECVSRGFPGVEVDTDVSKAKGVVPIPDSKKIPTNKEEVGRGCLVVDVGYQRRLFGSDHLGINGDSWFSKWEMALVEGDYGLIYIGFVQALNITGGLFEDIDHENFVDQYYNYVYQVVREGDKWKIKDGLFWTSKLHDHHDHQSSLKALSIQVLGKEKLTSSEVHPEKDVSQKYIGIGEEGGVQKVQDILEIKKDGKKNYGLWNSNTLENDDELSVYSNGKGGVADNATREMFSTYISNIYSPGDGRLGTGTDLTNMCEDSGWKRGNMNKSAIDRMSSFCYQSS